MLLTSSGFAPRPSRPAFVAFLLGEGQSTTFHAPVRTAVNFDNARQSSLFSPGKRLGCEAPDDDKLLRLDHTSHPVLTIVVTQICVHMCVCLSGGEVRGCARAWRSCRRHLGSLWAIGGKRGADTSLARVRVMRQLSVTPPPTRLSSISTDLCTYMVSTPRCVAASG
ncbi:hypothetical protein C0Q70_03744 [Pomacea canaliculata]|uniref:Uncharacterized protein n=1 Tax=Pomacea canaliculata TaxID=400727 RepID=A0A2T7PTK2_POMCA|nr:hypothetical protein C0Q70_03744 [Pomacea canaliculata]